MQTHFGFPVKGMALVDFAWGLPPGRNYDSLHLIGGRGAGYADDHCNLSLLYGGDNPRALLVGNRLFAIGSMLKAFHEATSESMEPSVQWVEMVRVKRVFDAVLRASEEKQVFTRDGASYVGGRE